MSYQSYYSCVCQYPRCIRVESEFYSLPRSSTRLSTHITSSLLYLSSRRFVQYLSSSSQCSIIIHYVNSMFRSTRRCNSDGNLFGFSLQLCAPAAAESLPRFALHSVVIPLSLRYRRFISRKHTRIPIVDQGKRIEGLYRGDHASH